MEMKVINSEESERFYSSLPEEIQDIFRKKIILIYISEDVLYWKSSVSDEEKQILMKHNAALKTQLRIVFNCSTIKAIQDEEEKVMFFKQAIELLSPTKIEFNIA